MQQVHRRWSKAKIIVRNELPNHFPGGAYSKHHTNTSEQCDLDIVNTTNTMTNKIVSALILVGNQTGAQILDLDANELYFDGGNAHVGSPPEKPHFIDCRHWCIAPGVLDALARMTLAAISRIHYI